VDAIAPTSHDSLPTDVRQGIGRKYLLPLYGVAVLIIATIFGALDRQMVVLLADPISKSLDLSDGQIGVLLGLGLTLCSGLAAVPLGWLADRYDRRKILAACLLLWAAATAGCGFADNFTEMLIAAAVMGLGESGVSPIVWGLIPQIVPERYRLLANGVFMLAANLGWGLGIWAAGVIVDNVDVLRPFLPFALQDIDPWRVAFVAVALPGPVIAVLLLLIRTYHQAASAAGEVEETIMTMRSYIRDHIHTLATVFVGIGFLMFGVAASTNWIPTLAARSFGVSTGEISAASGSAYFFGTLGGGAAYFIFGPMLRRKIGAGAAIWAYVITLAMASVMSVAVLFARSANDIFILFGLQYGTTIFASTFTPTLLQDMTPANLRSRVVGIAVTIGFSLSALGPLAVGTLSDQIAGVPDHIRIAVVVMSTGGLLMGSLLMFLGRKSFVRTVEASRPRMSQMSQ